MKRRLDEKKEGEVEDSELEEGELTPAASFHGERSGMNEDDAGKNTEDVPKKIITAAKKNRGDKWDAKMEEIEESNTSSVKDVVVNAKRKKWRSEKWGKADDEEKEKGIDKKTEKAIAGCTVKEKNIPNGENVEGTMEKSGHEDEQMKCNQRGKDKEGGKVALIGGTDIKGEAISFLAPNYNVKRPPGVPHNPLLHGCRSVEAYEQIEFIAQGTYGIVFKARGNETGDIVAVKRVKMGNEDREGFPVTALRETNVLLSLNHPNIVRVKEMVMGSTPDKVYMVMEHFETDLKSLMQNRLKQGDHFITAEVKCLMQQLLSGVAHLHEHWYIHRDIKSSNVLYGSGGRLAICDFGLARKYEYPLRPYTHVVVTLWYRGPELLLGCRVYGPALDMWSVGCMMGELLRGEPLFQGKGEVDQLSKVFSVLGTPTELSWPGWRKLPNGGVCTWKLGTKSKLEELFPATGGFSSGGRPVLSPKGFDLLGSMLTLNPEKRISSESALKGSWFEESPRPMPQEYMPPPL